jgi:glycosyltransferase involved in cell wall biosynthesis
MRIAFAFEGSIPSPQADAEVFLNTAAALARRGHAVSYLFPQRSAKFAGAKAILDHYGIDGSLRFVPLRNPFRQRTAQHGLQALRVPLSEAYRQSEVLYTRNLTIVATGLARGKPVFFDHYRPFADQRPSMQPLLRACMTHPKFLGMACHSEVARASFSRIGVPAERLRVIRNGFDPARSEPVLSKADARELLGFDSSRSIVVYTGRVNERKGLDVVLAMAAGLPEMLFVLVGSAGDGNAIEREAERSGNVLLVPWQPPDAVSPYLYAADVLLVPPSIEPLLRFGTTVLPLKVYLYMAAGRPILAGATPDVCEVLRHRENAFLVDPGDVDQAVDALRMLCRDHDLAARLAHEATRDAVELTWDARAGRLETFLLERLAAPHIRSVEAGWSITGWLGECVRRRGVRS